jgi:hypothetical protein
MSGRPSCERSVWHFKENVSRDRSAGRIWAPILFYTDRKGYRIFGQHENN